MFRFENSSGRMSLKNYQNDFDNKNQSNYSIDLMPFTMISDEDEEDYDNTEDDLVSLHGISRERSSKNSFLSHKDRRRKAHTKAEQKRRDAIKKGYENLQSLVPGCLRSDEEVFGNKISKAAVLQKSIEYIQAIKEENLNREKKLDHFRKEVLGLRIIHKNYEKMTRKYQQSSLSQNRDTFDLKSSLPAMTDSFKLEIFKNFCDNLFQSFDRTVQTDNFNQLSAGTIWWLEENCDQCNLQRIMLNIIEPIKFSFRHYYQQPQNVDYFPAYYEFNNLPNETQNPTNQLHHHHCKDYYYPQASNQNCLEKNC